MKASFFFALILTLMFVSAQIASSEKSKNAAINRNDVVSQKNDIQKIKDDFDQKISSQQQLTQTLFNGVSTQLTAFNNNLVLISIGIIFFGFLISAYVTRVARKIEAMYETHKSVKEEVDSLNDKINNNLRGLYTKIRDEETKHMMARLERVPEDIANLVHALTSRELSKDHYSKLKRCFMILNKKPFKLVTGSWLAQATLPAYKEQSLTNYAVLLFQHFADLVLFDDEIVSEIEKRYVPIIEAAFENDIIKSTSDFIGGCIDNNLEQQRDKVNKYFEAVNKSTYADFSGVYDAAYEKLINKQNRFLFYGLLKKDPGLDKTRYEISLRLARDYKTVENTESQKLALNEMDELIKRIEKK